MLAQGNNSRGSALRVINVLLIDNREMRGAGGDYLKRSNFWRLQQLGYRAWTRVIVIYYLMCCCYTFRQLAH